MRSQLNHGLESLRVVPMLHEPAGGLGTEVDTQGENERRDECGTKLETPREGTSVLNGDVGDETQKNACTILISK